MSGWNEDDVAEVPDDTGDPPHPQGPHGEAPAEDATETEEWLGDVVEVDDDDEVDAEAGDDVGG